MNTDNIKINTDHLKKHPLRFYFVSFCGHCSNSQITNILYNELINNSFKQQTERKSTRSQTIMNATAIYPLGVWNRNGLRHAVVAMIVFGVLSTFFLALRIVRYKKKRKKEKNRFNPKVLGFVSQVSCIFFMFSTAWVYANVDCEYYNGFPWKYITSCYTAACVAGYLFLYTKQKAVGGAVLDEKQRAFRKILIRIFLIGLA